MNIAVFERKWKKFRAQDQIQGVELTDDDLETVNGKPDKLIGLIQEKYGYIPQQAEEEWEKRTK